MRVRGLPSSIVLALIVTTPLAAQQSDKPKIPKKGDVIVVEGCLRGSAVESADLLIVDEEGTPRAQNQVPRLTYRLQGNKSVLKELKQKFDRMVVQVKGTLRSELSRSGVGTEIGGTKVMIGVDPKNARTASQPMPVLEAQSYEGSTVSCVK
jgi:hypothetical protein